MSFDRRFLASYLAIYVVYLGYICRLSTVSACHSICIISIISSRNDNIGVRQTSVSGDISNLHRNTSRMIIELVAQR